MSTQRTAVVVGTDGSRSAEHAIAWAADEAARTGRQLRVLHVLETPSRLPPGGASDAAGPAAAALLRDGRSIALGRRPDLRIEAVPIHDRSVADGLRRYADEAAEIVIGHRGRGGFTGLLLGSTALNLAGRCPGPVVVVRGQTEEMEGEVVVGVDLVEDPAPALDHAFTAAAARDVRLRVLHSWRPAPLAVEAGVDLAEAADTFRSHLTALLAPWRERFPAVKVVEEVVIGHPVESLIIASARADLLVVGSRGKTVPLGSVSHGAIHHARCPVAVVRPRG